MRVPLGQLQAQDVLILRDGGDRLAGHDARGRPRPAIVSTRPAPGASTAPSLRLLHDHVAVGLASPSRLRSATSSVGLGLVELGLRADAALLQFGHAIEIGLGLVALRLLRGDARIERLHLQGELLVGDDGRSRRRRRRVSPSLTPSEAIVPPMRARATSWCTGSTVAITAFRSAASVE